MLSYWERESFLTYDFGIVGSGIVGLSAALSLKERNPAASVVVLERGLLPSGASTKNAGFACFGSLTELLDDIDAMGEEKAINLVEERLKGLEMLRQRLGDKAIHYQNHGGYELLRQQELGYLDKLDHVNSLLTDIFNQPAYQLKSDLIPRFGFKGIEALIYSPYEGQIHTGEMMKTLLLKAQTLGITLLTGADVAAVEDSNQGATIHVRQALSNENLSIKVGKAAICTNAFTSDLIPDLELNPGRGIVLVTKALSRLPFEGVFHMDKGFYYFRNEGKRVIFGGGRNLDFDNEATTSFEINNKILEVLKEKLTTQILPGIPYEVDHVWAGIMAFGPNKQPVLRHHSEHIILGVRLGGMGVAIGSRLGDKVAEMLL